MTQRHPVLSRKRAAPAVPWSAAVTNDVNVDMVRSFLLDARAEDGGKLPTERALAEDLGASHKVIRKALGVSQYMVLANQYGAHHR
jgi:hypothetical protein